MNSKKLIILLALAVTLKHVRHSAIRVRLRL